MKRSVVVLAVLFAGGCPAVTDVARQAGLAVDVKGHVEIDGTAPAGYTLNLYSNVDNSDAFDPSFCKEPSPDCFGRVDVEKLSAPQTDNDGNPLTVTWNGDRFTFEKVPVDFFYVL